MPVWLVSVIDGERNTPINPMGMRKGVEISARGWVAHSPLSAWGDAVYIVDSRLPVGIPTPIYWKALLSFERPGPRLRAVRSVDLT